MNYKGNTLWARKDGRQVEEALWKNESLQSQNKKFSLRFQDDGNLVIYWDNRPDEKDPNKKSDVPIWASHTQHADVDGVRMQIDGNLVMYHPGGKNAKWATGTNGSGAVKAVLENWGDLVLYDGEDRIVWSSINNNKSKWMSAVDGELTLKKICIPGAHDAGMYYTKNTIYGLALCQSLNIKQQLENGVRYFDLRPYNNDGEFYIYHGKADGPKLDKVLDSIADYCKTNEAKSEVFILSFTDFKEFGNDGSNEKRMAEMIFDKIGSYMYAYTGNGRIHEDVKLKELRGKIIVATDNSKLKSAMDTDAGKKGKIQQLGGSFDRIDQYSNKQDYPDMLEHQKGEFKKFNNGMLFLLNWTLTPRGDNWFQQGVSVGEEIVRHIPLWAAIRWVVNGNNPTIGKVEAYARQINPLLILKLKENDELFRRNPKDYIVNIINMDYVELGNALPVCRYVASHA